MHVAIDISQVIFGTGVSRYTKELINHLVDLKDIRLTLFGGSLRRRQEINNFAKRLPKTIVKTFPFPPTLSNHLWNTLHILPIEKLIGPVDLVHTSDWSEPPSKYPKVTTVHDLSFLKNPEFMSASIRQVHKKRLYWAVKEDVKIIAISHATKTDLLDYFDIAPDRVEVVYEGPTLSPPASQSPTITESLLRRLGIEKPFFLVPGSGHPRKNIKRILQAFTQFSDYHLTIIGRPSSEEILLSRNLSNVTYTGFIPDVDLPYLYSEAELVLYPSLYEGFGLPILDAFVCSTPVVTSNVSSLPEVAGNAAILVDPTSVESIIEGIKKALNNPDTLIQLGNNQLKNFSWEKAAKETYNVYKAAIKNQ